MRILRIQTGWVQVKRYHPRARFEGRGLRALDVLCDRQWTERLPINCWLVEHPEGLLMIDTGESSHANDPGYQPWWHPFMQTCGSQWVMSEEESGAQLRKIGLNPEDVRWVIMTHMHGDHAGGLPHFPKSQIMMSREEIDLATSRFGPLQGYLNNHYPKWLKPREVTFGAGAWESFASSASLTRDGAIRIVPTPGHTKGHISVAIEDGYSLIFVAGDAAYSEGGLLEGVVDGVAVSAVVHRQTTARIRALCERRAVITQFAHDPDNERRLSQRIPTRPLPVTDPAAHTSLRTALTGNGIASRNVKTTDRHDPQILGVVEEIQRLP